MTKIEKILTTIFRPKGDFRISLFGKIYLWKAGAYMGYHTK